MILVDPRQGSGDLLRLISMKVSCEVKHSMLDSGDVAFEGSGPNGDCFIGVEIKSVGDALNCLRSGRYTGLQLPKMEDTFTFCYFILEGIFRPNEEGLIETWQGKWAPLNMRNQRQRKSGQVDHRYYAELDKFLTTLEMRKNVMVKRSTSRTETAWQIANLYTWFQKPWDKHDSAEATKVQLRSGLSSFGASSVCRRMASELPHIGWELAGRVEKHFGMDVARMVNADEAAWAEITWKTASGRRNSIGKKKAADIVSALRGKS